eukprot:gene7670-12136_t
MLKLTKQFQKKFVRNLKYIRPDGKKHLDDIVDVNLLLKEPYEQIVHIWNSYHEFKLDLISDALKSSSFKILKERGNECPNFVLPLQKKRGYINYYLQFQKDYILFTSLREFQLKGDQAHPVISLSHYDELEKTKDLTLLRGEVNEKIITREESMNVVKMMYQFYFKDNLYYRFVEPFNKRPNEFNYEKFLEEVEHSKPKKVVKVPKSEILKK